MAQQLIDVRLEQVRKRFGGAPVVDGVSLEVFRGEILSLLGPSGCGKTTTLRMIAGLEESDEGNIIVRERRVNDIAPYKRNVGMVFQSYALFPHMSVFENVAFGLRMRRASRREIEERVASAMSLVRLSGLESRFPSQLSGGQRQRVALARALAPQPTVLLLDEPMASLDKKLRDQVQMELKQLQRALGITTVFVTHDQSEALILSDRIAVMNDGHIQQIGTPEELYERPANEFVANFLGETNLVRGRLVEVGGAGCTVELGGGYRVPAIAHDGAAVGDPVKLAVRPERVEVSAVGSIDARALGVVRRIIYGGASVSIEIEMPFDDAMTARISSRSAHTTWQIGDRVAVSWLREDARIYPLNGPVDDAPSLTAARASPEALSAIANTSISARASS